MHLADLLFVYPAQVEEQVKLLQKGVTHIGVGTPGRLQALIEKGKAGWSHRPPRSTPSPWLVL